MILPVAFKLMQTNIWRLTFDPQIAESRCRVHNRQQGFRSKPELPRQSLGSISFPDILGDLALKTLYQSNDLLHYMV